MKIVTWNVNSIRAAAERKSVKTLLEELGPDADIVCMQETKLNQDTLTQAIAQVEGYESFWSFCKTRKGYSGVATYAKTATACPVRASAAPLGESRFDDEGRVLETDHGAFVLLNVYCVNGGQGPARAQFKLEFHAALARRCEQLREDGRAVIVAGDLNIAHRPEDLDEFFQKNPSSGFLPEERAWMDAFLDPGKGGFRDSFRMLYPDATKAYSFWETKKFHRESNCGWRIDYVLISSPFAEENLLECSIDAPYKGSDHAPVICQLRPQPAPGPPRTPVGTWPCSARCIFKGKGGERPISSFFAKRPRPTEPAPAPAPAPASDPAPAPAAPSPVPAESEKEDGESGGDSTAAKRPKGSDGDD
eukprot:tig00022075_g23643.t1